MSTTHHLVQTPEIEVRVVACSGRVSTWSEEEEIETLAVILVSAGMFRRRVRGIEVVADPMVAFTQRPGDVQRIAHPRGGDVCTMIVVSEPLLGAATDPRRTDPATLLVPPAVDLAQRTLLARARAGADEFELIERATAIVGALLEPEHRQARISPTERRLAMCVRENLEAQSPSRLVDLSRENGVSAYQLRRAFQRVTGLSVTSYRNQLRLRRAMARLASGDRNLAGIAVDVGFADQAHLSRTARAYSGLTPGTLRCLLNPTAHA